MAKFGCTCGHVISDVACPNEVTGKVLSDKSGDLFFDAIESVIDDYLSHLCEKSVKAWHDKHFKHGYPHDLSGGTMIHDILTSKFFDLTLSVMECDECGRLWIQTAPGVNSYRAYSPDAAVSGGKVLGFNSGE